jgi:hypothetical protein
VKKARHLYYELICLIFEKYGYEVITSNDNKTLWVSRHPDLSKSILFTELEDILEKEELSPYINDILPIYLSSWKIVVA